MARQDVIRCHACAAPLSVEAGQQLATCGYCRSTNPIGRPLPGMRSRGETERAPRSAIPVVLAVVLALGTAAVASYMAVVPGLGLTGEWTSVACLVDANGDDVLDAAGRTGPPGGTQRLTVVDGRDGSVLWKAAEDDDYESWVLCLGPTRVAVSRPDFSVRLYDAQKPTAIKNLALADRVMRYGRTDDCAALHLLDGSTVGISLSSGDGTTCDVEPTHQTNGMPLRSDEEPTVVTNGDVSYTLEEKQPGTATLTVIASRHGHELWRTALPHVAVDEPIHLAATDDRVLTYGMLPGNREDAFLIGLDASTGDIVYQKAQGRRWATYWVTTFAYNNHALLVTWGFGLHGYDPVTGDRTWNLAGR